MEGDTLDDDKLPNLVDQFITCSLPAQDDLLRQKVLDLQVHHHTKSCLKRSGNCRFNYPRLPSQKTLIAKPNGANLNKEQVKKSIKILSDAKQILLSSTLPETFDEFFTLLSPAERV